MSDFIATFTPQLLAALSGAVVGIVGVRLAFHWQAKAAKRDAFEAAAGNAIVALAQYAHDSSAATYRMQASLRGQSVFIHPNRDSASAALEVLAIRAPKNERPIAAELQRTWSAMNGYDHPEVGCSWLTDAIAAWARGASHDEVRAGFDAALRSIVEVR